MTVRQTRSPSQLPTFQNPSSPPSSMEVAMGGRLTKAQRNWLERLEREGPQRRARTNTGYYCMRAGWSEWVIVAEDGTATPIRDIPLGETPNGAAWLEGITDAGRTALREVPHRDP